MFCGVSVFSSQWCDETIEKEQISPDAPIFVSFPHFYLGDPVLLETVEGLKPDPKRHEMYLDLHSELGVPLSGKSAFQVNVMVMKANGVDHLDAFNDRDILPISWVNVHFQEGAGRAAGELRFAMYHVTFSVRALQLVLMYGLPAVAACCALALLREWLRARPPARAAPPPVPAATRPPHRPQAPTTSSSRPRPRHSPTQHPHPLRC
ncbi:Protein croquemort [Gryllus bimaculatus]|nr:Protein croquemort [Gryllus bimaculatus]